MNKTVKNTAYSALMIALAVVLPFLTANNQQLGNVFSLMHIPVFICGFICGSKWGALTGAVSPLLRSLLFGMPVMMPTAVAMSFELMSYGLLCGVFSKKLPQKNVYIYPSLVLSMILGRIVSALVRFALSFAGVSQSDFSFAAYFYSVFVTALPGIILHIVLVPFFVMLLRRLKIIN